MLRKSIALFLAIFIFCIGATAYAQERSVLSERLIVRVDFSSWLKESFKVSPDSKRVVYAAQVGNKRFVVVDGKEEKQYDAILKDTPIFSPDSKRLAYGAQAGNKQFVVVDGKGEKQYDGIVAIGGGGVVFDSPNSLHYLALKGNSIYFVEERLK